MDVLAPRPLAHQLTVVPRLENLGQVTAFVARVLAEAGAAPEFAKQMKLVVDESVCNAIDHGCSNSGVGEVRISCEVAGESFRLVVEDFHGRLFDPEYFQRIALVRDWGKGGRGILLIAGLMDHVSYLIEEGRHTLLYMEKRLPPAPPAAGAPASPPGGRP